MVYSRLTDPPTLNFVLRNWDFSSILLLNIPRHNFSPVPTLDFRNLLNPKIGNFRGRNFFYSYFFPPPTCSFLEKKFINHKIEKVFPSYRIVWPGYHFSRNSPSPRLFLDFFTSLTATIISMRRRRASGCHLFLEARSPADTGPGDKASKSCSSQAWSTV